MGAAYHLVHLLVTDVRAHSFEDTNELEVVNAAIVIGIKVLHDSIPEPSLHL